MKHPSTPAAGVGTLEPPGEGNPPVASGLPESAPSTPPQDLHSIACPLSPSPVIDRLARESKRGRLAGFRTLPDGAAAVTAFGGIYDHELIIRPSPATPPATGSSIDFSLRLLPKMPAIAIALFIVSIVPGLQITDSMLKIYFSWYTIETWWWYLPLVLLSAPLMWKQFRAAQAEARRDARATIEKLRTMLK